MPLFAVIRTYGSAWQPGVSLEGQRAWREHAQFMNALEAEGVVLLGGPLEETPDVLLVICANGEEEIRTRLSGDPWTSLDLLRIRSIARWTLRLGTLPARSRTANTEENTTA
jgi:hypothetical protein